jgi:hypothetical protein
VALSADYKNPKDTVSKLGAKFTLDSTAYWNGQTMRRIELIPQTKAAIASGKVFYHFSIARKDTNAPSVNKEHQICFFESHFTELKYGWISGESGTSNPNLQWMVSQKSYWKVEWKPDVWHNVAYEIVSGLLVLDGRRPAQAGRGARLGLALVQRRRLAPGRPRAPPQRVPGHQRGLLLLGRLHRERLHHDRHWGPRR